MQGAAEPKRLESNREVSKSMKINETIFDLVYLPFS